MEYQRRLTKLPDESLRFGLLLAPAKTIMSVIVADSGITSEEIWSKSRKLNVVITRQLLMYMLTVNIKIPFEQIASIFGKNHATVIHARNTIENWIDTNHEMKLRVIRVSTKIINSL